MNKQAVPEAVGHEGHGDCGENLSHFVVESLKTEPEVLDTILAALRLDGGETLEKAIETELMRTSPESQEREGRN